MNFHLQRFLAPVPHFISADVILQTLAYEHNVANSTQMLSEYRMSESSESALMGNWYSVRGKYHKHWLWSAHGINATFKGDVLAHSVHTLFQINVAWYLSWLSMQRNICRRRYCYLYSSLTFGIFPEKPSFHPRCPQSSHSVYTGDWNLIFEQCWALLDLKIGVTALAWWSNCWLKM